MNFVLGRPVIIIDTHIGLIFILYNLILPTIYLFFETRSEQKHKIHDVYFIVDPIGNRPFWLLWAIHVY